MAIVGAELARNRVINPRGALAAVGDVVIRKNLAANPSVESNATGYSVVPGTGGSATGARTTFAQTWLGLYHYRATWTVSTTAAGGGLQYAGASGLGVPVTAGLPYSVSWYIKQSKAQRLQIQLRWHDAAGLFLSSSDGTPVVAQSSTSFHTRMQITAVAPVGAVNVRIRVVSVTGTGFTQWLSGDWLAGDAILVEQTTKVLDYFDRTYAYFGRPGLEALTGAQTLSDDVANVRLNLAANPSAAVDALSYTTSWGTVGATSVRDTTKALVGNASFRLSRTAETGTSGFGWRIFAESLAAAEVFTFSVYLWSPVERTVVTHAQFIYIDRVDTETAGGISGIGTSKVLAPEEWTRIDCTVTVPAGQPVAEGYFGFKFDDPSTDPIWADAVLIERGSTLRTYFDGDTLADGAEQHIWGQTPTGNAVPGLIFSRRIASRVSGYNSELGAEVYRHATGGIGVIGSVTRASAAGSGVYAFTTAPTDAPATLIAKVKAIDAVTLQAFGTESIALAAGQEAVLRKVAAPAIPGFHQPIVTQSDTESKRWVVLGFAVVPDATYDGPYFDGSMLPPGPDSRYIWDGIPDFSESIWEFLPAPVLTLDPDPDLRSVELLAEGIPSTKRISIRRITPGYPTKLVRPAQEAVSNGGVLLAYDHEPPLGLTSSYQAMAHFSDGSTSGWSTEVDFVNGVDPNEVWLKDPGQPLRSVRLVIRDLGGRVREAREERHDIAGAEHPLIISDVRSSASEDMVFGTKSHAELDQFDALIGTGAVLLIQTPPDWGRRDAFCSLGTSREVRLWQYGPHPHRNWEVPLTEVAPPTGDRTRMPGNTYQVILDTFATYADLLAARPTYLSVLAGTAVIA